LKSEVLNWALGTETVMMGDMYSVYGWTTLCSTWFCCIVLQVEEIYTSGGDLHLELPTGEREASRELWVCNYCHQ